MCKLIFIFMMFFASISQAITLECNAIKKLDSERAYPQKILDKYKYSNKVEFTREGIFVSRCSYTDSEKKVTCDRYKVDHIEKDKNVNITKFYVFKNQFNIQLFSDNSYIEDNGRGGIAYGNCNLLKD